MGRKKTHRGPPHRVDEDTLSHFNKLGVTLRQCSEYHYRLEGDGYAVDWWPQSGKWMLPGFVVKIGGFMKMMKDAESQRRLVLLKRERDATAHVPVININDPQGLKDLDARTGARA